MDIALWQAPETCAVNTQIALYISREVFFWGGQRANNAPTTIWTETKKNEWKKNSWILLGWNVYSDE